MATRDLGQLATASVRLDIDKKDYDKTLARIRSDMSGLKGDVVFGGGGSGSQQTAQQIKKQVSIPLIAAGAMFGQNLSGTFSSLDGRLRYMQGEMRITGETLAKSFKAAEKSTAVMSKLMSQTAKYASNEYNQGIGSALTGTLGKQDESFRKSLGNIVSPWMTKGSDQPATSQTTTPQDTVTGQVTAAVQPAQTIANFFADVEDDAAKAKAHLDALAHNFGKSTQSGGFAVSRASVGNAGFQAPPSPAASPAPTAPAPLPTPQVTSAFDAVMVKAMAFNRTVAESFLAAEASFRNFATSTRTYKNLAVSAFHAVMASIHLTRGAITTFPKWWMAAINRISPGLMYLRAAGKALSTPFRALGSVVKAGSGLFRNYDRDVRKAGSGFKGLAGMVANFANPLNAVGHASNGLGSAFKKLGSIARGVFQHIAALTVVGLAATASKMFNAVGAASSLNEALDYSGQRWKGNAGAVKQFAEDLADATGESKRFTIESMSMFGGILKDAGFADQHVLKMSKNLTLMAEDLASARNISTDDALTKLRGGLSGETESLKAIGVLMNESMVKQEAYRIGVAQTGEELSETQKVAARYSLVMKKLSDDQGNLALTSGSVANQQRELASRWENLQATIGERLLPLASRFLGMLNQWVVSSQAAAEGGAGWFDWLVEKIEVAFEGVAFVVRNWAEIWDLVWLRIKTFGVNVVEVFKWLGPAILSTGLWLLDNWQEIAVDLGNILWVSFENTVHNLKKLWSDFTGWLTGEGSDNSVQFKGLTEGFQRQSKELVLPELKLSGIDEKKLAEIGERMNKNEAKKEPEKPKIVPYEAVDIKEAYAAANDDGTGKEGKQKKEGGEFIDILEYFKKIQGGALSKDDKEKKKQTNFLETIAKNTAVKKDDKKVAVAGK